MFRFYGKFGGFFSTVEIHEIYSFNSLIFTQVAELIGGYFAGSLAIMADAAHLLSDCISFIVALIAIWWARKPADDRMSFGYKRLGKLPLIKGNGIQTLAYRTFQSRIQSIGA